MIEKLLARGFTGIKRGIGDEIEIDFAGREGLICLDGKNGAGKSSVLDLLHPYAQLASRDGALYTHTFLRDSLKELTFTHGGHHYRTVIKVDCDSGRSEGYAYVDGGASVTTGKISEYHKWAVQTFGSPELFFASLFCAQNSKKFSDMRVGELKSLFVEFLRLERYEAWADTSKQAGNILQGRLEGVGQRIAALEEQAGRRAALEEHYLVAGSRAESCRDSRTELEQLLAEQRVVADGLKATIAKNAALGARKADLERTIARMKDDLSRERKAAEGEIAALKAKCREIAAEIENCDAVLKEREAVEGAAERIRELEARTATLLAFIEEQSADYPVRQKKAHDLETLIASLRQKVRDAANDPENIRLGKLVEEAERAVKENERELRDMDSDFQLIALEREVVNLNKAAQVGDGIDADCKSGTCAAIKSVNDAREKLPQSIKSVGVRKTEVEAIKAQIRERITTIKRDTAAVLEEKAKLIEGIKQSNAVVEAEISKTVRDLNEARQELAGADLLLSSHRKDLAAGREEIKTLSALAARANEITVADVRRKDLGRQQEEALGAGMKRKETWLIREAELSAQINGEALNLMELGMQIDSEAPEKLRQLSLEIGNIEKVRIPDIEKEIQKARDVIAEIKSRMNAAEEAERELEAARKQREDLAKEISRWRYLQAACGKNGLQALEIDGAAPLISSRANELLMQGYGPQFTVRIDTQDEEGREDLDIKVLSEWGTDSLKDKSGGERVWLLHPIRLAMALLNKEKSGRAWDMAFFDEITGALDSKGAATSFMDMYVPFMRIGGIRQLFFVTHQDECLSYADHVLRFEAGKNPEWG